VGGDETLLNDSRRLAERAAFPDDISTSTVS
jgi:hypothetical protein